MEISVFQKNTEDKIEHVTYITLFRQTQTSGYINLIF